MEVDEKILFTLSLLIYTTSASLIMANDAEGSGHEVEFQ